jgi:hypothetical protein
MQPGQPPAVPPVGLHPIPRRLRDQRRRHHLAGHPHRGQQPVQTEPDRAGLIADPQLTTVAEPVDQPADRRLVVEDLLHVRGHLVRAQDPTAIVFLLVSNPRWTGSVDSATLVVITAGSFRCGSFHPAWMTHE